MKSTTANIVIISLLAIVVIAIGYNMYGGMDKKSTITYDKDGNPVSKNEDAAKV